MRHTSPADVVRESFRIEREMRELGWKVVRMSGADLKLFLPLPDGRNVHVDVFGAFHVEGVFYQLGGRSGTLARSALTPASTVVLEGVELAAPADPEAVLEFLYGPDWRVPDPAFQPVDPPAGLRRLDGWLRGFRTHVIAWNELLRYRRDEIPRQGSSFAPWAQHRMPADAKVVDLGAGNGRDSAWFARRGPPGRCLRLLRRRRAPDQAQAGPDRASTEPDVRVLVLNDTRSVLLTGAELARDPEPPVLYARGLVGCLDEDARRNLWRLASMSLRRGGALFLEFAAARRGLPSHTIDGLVQRVALDDLVREITAAGGHVVHLKAGGRSRLLRPARPPCRPTGGPMDPDHRPPRSNHEHPDHEAGAAGSARPSASRSASATSRPACRRTGD